MDKQVENEYVKHENDNITVHLYEEPGCCVKLDIFVNPNAAQAAYKKAVKMINKEVSVPGFRKGKAPEDWIIDTWGSEINKQWKELLVQTAYGEAISLIQVYPMNQESVQKPQIKKASREEGAEVTIEFEKFPVIPTLKMEDFHLKHVEKHSPTSQEIENYLDDLRHEHANWSSVEGRGVEEGDYIIVDIEDEDHPGRYLCKKTRFKVAEGKMGDWMRRLVAGKHVDEAVSGLSERSPDLDPEKEFKPTNCKITILEIQTAELPELNDEFAKKFGAENLEDMRKKAEARLHRESAEAVKHQLRRQVQEIIKTHYSFDVPASMVKTELNARLKDFKESMQRGNLSPEEIQQKLSELKHGLEKQVDHTCRLYFIASKIVKENHIQISEKDVLEEVLAKWYESGARDGFDMENEKNKAYFSVLIRKAEDFLVEHAKIE